MSEHTHLGQHGDSPNRAKPANRAQVEPLWEVRHVVDVDRLHKRAESYERSRRGWWRRLFRRSDG